VIFRKNNRGARGRPITVSRALTQFALSVLAALVVVAVGGTYALRNASTDEEVRDATQLARAYGKGIVEPLLDDAILGGKRRQQVLQTIDAAVQERILVREGEVKRVKIWTRGGRIVYSDEPRLIDKQYPLDPDDKAVFVTRRADAEVSDLSREENRFEKLFGEKLLEVYFPVRTKDGTMLLFEAYLKYDAVVAGGERIREAIAPVFFAALAVLALLQIPLAWSMARQLREGHRERENLLLRAIEASDAERRRIARDLHDGVVQDLAGVSYNLTAAAGRPEALAPPEAKRALRDGASATRKSMRKLRSLLVEIYPPRLQDQGLEAALADLVTPLIASGINAQLHTSDGIPLSPEVERFLFRAAQEALRNVGAHSKARTVDVRFFTKDGRALLVVEDDGKGFAPEDAARRREGGHFGLAFLADFAADLGGTVDVWSEPGRGTRVAVEVPAQ
jgi:two-component system, NarL family, sensor kinase